MLEGRQVRLRPREVTDLERVYTWINDPEVTRFLDSGRYPISRADERRWLEEHPRNNYANGVGLAIETKDGAHIGNIDLMRVRPEDRKAGLGIMIGEKDYWSNGYGTDAIIVLLRFAFGEMNLHRVWLTVDTSNERAVACYRKCGFQEEARLRQDRYTAGRYWDTLFMGILHDEFEALHGKGQNGEEVA